MATTYGFCNTNLDDMVECCTGLEVLVDNKHSFDWGSIKKVSVIFKKFTFRLQGFVRGYVDRRCGKCAERDSSDARRGSLQHHGPAFGNLICLPTTCPSFAGNVYDT